MKKPDPTAPFSAAHQRAWPRAGVRRRPDGLWAMVLWTAPAASMHPWYGAVGFADRLEAIDLGATLTAAYRTGGTTEATS